MQVLLLGVRRLFVGRNKGKGRNALSFTKISAVAAVCVRYFFINSSLWAVWVLLGQFLVFNKP